MGIIEWFKNIFVSVTVAAHLASPLPSVLPSSTPTPSAPPSPVPIETIAPAPSKQPLIQPKKVVVPSPQVVSFQCQIDNKWYTYTSQEKCYADQKAFNDNYQAALNGGSSQPSYSETEIDCNVNGTNLGKMSYALCTQKSNEYYSTLNTQNQSTIQQANDLQKKQAVQDCLNKYRAIGAINSSAAQSCYK